MRAGVSRAIPCCPCCPGVLTVRLGCLFRCRATLLCQSARPPTQRRLLIIQSTPAASKSAEGQTIGDGGRDGGSDKRGEDRLLVSVDERGDKAVRMLPPGSCLVADAVDVCAWSPSGHFVASVARLQSSGAIVIHVNSAVDGQLISTLSVSSASSSSPSSSQDAGVSALQWSGYERGEGAWHVHVGRGCLLHAYQCCVRR